MATGALEHVNVTVSNPTKTAALLCELFDWHVRWQGESKMGGETVHVGNEGAYLALYTQPSAAAACGSSYARHGGLNHIGVVVEDLEGAEQRVLAAGYQTHNHGDYEPGRRFYFNDPDGIEFEVVSYA